MSGKKVDLMLASLKSIWVMLGVAAFVGLAGCGGTVVYSVGDPTPVPPVPGYAYMTGNWQMTILTSTGPASFSALAGFIDESPGTGGTNHATTAVFQLTPESCFFGATTLPMSGSVDTQAVNLRSFSDSGQFVVLTGTEDITGTHFTGTYGVHGGCASGAAGTLTGTKYAALSGSYSGSLGSATAPASAALSLTQSAFGNGKGFSPITGTATFTGFPCFNSGVLTSVGSAAIGSSVQLTFTANDGETVFLSGTFDSAATMINLTSGTISGGSCSGTVTPSTFTKS